MWSCLAYGWIVFLFNHHTASWSFLSVLVNFLNCFLFACCRAYAEDSVNHDSRAEPGEKVKHREEGESSGDEGRRAVASGSEEAHSEGGKKKKCSGFRDRKVQNLVILYLQHLHGSGKTGWTCTTLYSSSRVALTDTYSVRLLDCTCLL